MHWSCLHYLPILYHRKTKLQIMLSNWVSVSTKTPYVSKFTICFISITIRLLPMSIHFLIYDNTPSHNSPICITPSPSPPPPFPQSIQQRWQPRTRKITAYGLQFMGYFYLMIASVGCLSTIEWLFNGYTRQPVQTKVTPGYPIYLFYLFIYICHIK